MSLITLYLLVLAVSFSQPLPLLPAGTNVWPRGQTLTCQALRAVLGSTIQLCTAEGSGGEAAKPHSRKSLPSAVTKTPSKSCHEAQELKPMYVISSPGQRFAALLAVAGSCPSLISPNKQAPPANLTRHARGQMTRCRCPPWL